MTSNERTDGLTRRDIMIRSGGLAGLVIGGGTLLAACGGSSSSSSSSSSSGGGGGQATGGSVGFFTYAVYSEPVLTKAYTQSTGTSVRAENFGELGEMLSKLRATQGEGMDCISVSSNLVEPLAKEGLIQPLDTSRLKNWKNLYSTFQDADFLKYEGKTYGAPSVWGPEGLIYRTDKLKNVDSWDILWDEKYAGKLAAIDYEYEMVLTAAIHLGMKSQLEANPIAFSESDMEKIKSSLEEQVKLDAKLWADNSTAESLLASGEVYASIGRVLFLTDLKKKNIPVALINPKEGTQGWVTSTCISAGTDNLDRAYAFADYTMSPEYGLPLADEFGYPMTSEAGMKKLPAEQRKEMFLNDPDILEKMYFWKPAEGEEDWAKMWTEVKAGA